MFLHKFFRTPKRKFCLSLISFCSFFLFLQSEITAQKPMSSLERERNRQMLKDIKNELVKNYFDPKFRGVNIEEVYKKADELLKQVPSNSESFYIIANFLWTLNDSHTNFAPPSRISQLERGWNMQIVGDKCYVSAVKPGSDAEAKGLKEGDEILGIEGFKTSRDSMWKMKYLFYVLNPIWEYHLVVKPPSSPLRELTVKVKRIEGKRIIDLTDYNEYINLVREAERDAELSAHRYVEIGNELFIWKMPEFDLTKDKVDDMMSKASKRKALILDLRGNGGGAEETLLRLLGHFTEKDIKIGDIVRRKETKPLMVKSVGDKVFKGKLIVLVDSESGSSSEVFSRVIQMEKRGTIIGDKTAGAVMRAKFYSKEVGLDTVVLYGISITDADLVMTDGKSLEHVGITPDELLLPTPSDMAAKRDPVLSYAAKLLGIELSPEKAGTIFPVQWRS